MKNMVTRFAYLLILVSSTVIASKPTWQHMTRANLDVLYTQMKISHPKASDSTFHIGSAYGKSLNKIKTVNNESDFRTVISGFATLLKDPSIAIVSKKVSAVKTQKILKRINLPYGDLEAVIYSPS